MSDKTLRQLNLACFGSISAALTHELRNCLAILDQNVGLAEDLIAARADADTAERMARPMQRVHATLERAGEILTHMNAFAHSVDDPANRCADPRAVIDHLLPLRERHARQHRRELAFHVPEGEAPLVAVDPFTLYFILDRALAPWLLYGDGGRIEIRVAGQPKTVDFLFAGPTLEGEAQGIWTAAVFQELLTACGAGIHALETEGDRGKFGFDLPRT